MISERHVGILTMIICNRRSFLTWEEQRNNFTFDKEQEKYV